MEPNDPVSPAVAVDEPLVDNEAVPVSLVAREPQADQQAQEDAQEMEQDDDAAVVQSESVPEMNGVSGKDQDADGAPAKSQAVAVAAPSSGGALGMTCAQGHLLKPAKAVNAKQEFTCDACRRPQRGDIMLGCRQCNYDTCLGCAAALNNMDVEWLREEVSAAADAAASEIDKEAFDFCTRQALCPMTCVSDKCRLHLTSTLLLILSFFLFADQQLVAPNLSQIGDFFNLTGEDADFYLGGLLPLCFFAVGTPVTIFMGPIIDKVHRRNLFVILIFLGELPCMCTFWVNDIWQLLLTRAITGMSMAGAEPLIFSMLSDMYGVKERNVMASVITIGQGAGLLAGQSLAGFLGPTYGWKLPFLFVSCPSMAFSLLMLLLVEEPVRGAGEESVRNASAEAKELDSESAEVVYNSSFTCEKLCQIFRIPTNMLIYWSEIPASMGWGVLFAFLTDYVAQDKAFGVENATTCVAILGVGLAVGAVAGGIVGQHLNNTCLTFRGSVSVLVGTASLLGPLPYYWVIYADFACELDMTACLDEYNVSYVPTEINTSAPDVVAALATCTDASEFFVCPPVTWGVLIVLLFLSGLCLGVPTANARAMLLNTNLPETRGTAVAILVILSNFGKGFGPLVASLMIGSLGRPTSFTAITIVFSCAAITYFATAATYGRDIAKQVKIVEHQVRIRGLTDQSFEMKDLAAKLEENLAAHNRAEAGETAVSADEVIVQESKEAPDEEAEKGTPLSHSHTSKHRVSQSSDDDANASEQAERDGGNDDGNNVSAGIDNDGV